ncbi:Titin [Manis pentadactyla]|nr:Titin [Manis pentadactyla]
MKLKRRESSNGDSYPQSCCHVLPVRRQENDFNSSIVETYFRSNGFYEQDPEMIQLVLKKIQEEQEEVERERKWLLSSSQSSPLPPTLPLTPIIRVYAPMIHQRAPVPGPALPAMGPTAPIVSPHLPNLPQRCLQPSRPKLQVHHQLELARIWYNEASLTTLNLGPWKM